MQRKLLERTFSGRLQHVRSYMPASSGRKSQVQAISSSSLKKKTLNSFGFPKSSSKFQP